MRSRLPTGAPRRRGDREAEQEKRAQPERRELPQPVDRPVQRSSRRTLSPRPRRVRLRQPFLSSLPVGGEADRAREGEEQRGPDRAGLGRQAELEAVGYAGCSPVLRCWRYCSLKFPAPMPATGVVVGEIQRDPPEVVAGCSRACRTGCPRRLVVGCRSGTTTRAVRLRLSGCSPRRSVTAVRLPPRRPRNSRS